jgi:anti-sigma factor RsiW
MTQDTWSDRLSEYLDGELSVTDREALESHLASCGQCRATLEDLRGVFARARSLDDRPPARDLWSGIAKRIGAATEAGTIQPITSTSTRRRAFFSRRWTFSMPQLAAAAVALIVLSGAVVGGWMRHAEGTPLVPPLASPVMTVAAAEFGGAKYDAAVAELQQALDVNRNRLDTATVRVIRQNLAIIDRAIAQARQALAADPASVYLSDHLARTLKRKIELLRQATSLTVQS